MFTHQNKTFLVLKQTITTLFMVDLQYNLQTCCTNTQNMFSCATKLCMSILLQWIKSDRYNLKFSDSNRVTKAQRFILTDIKELKYQWCSSNNFVYEFFNKNSNFCTKIMHRSPCLLSIAIDIKHGLLCIIFVKNSNFR